MFFVYWKRIVEISIALERAKSECARLDEQYRIATINLDRVTQRAEAAEQRLHETNKMLCAIFSAGLQDDTQTIALEVMVDDRPVLLLSNRPVFSSKLMPDRTVN